MIENEVIKAIRERRLPMKNCRPFSKQEHGQQQEKGCKIHGL